MPAIRLLQRSFLASALLLSACSSSPGEDARSNAGASTQQGLGFAVPSKSLRVAVVGAGPSGLTAADTLRQLGYVNVTVLEKNDRVGGKVYSYRSGGTVTELGAVFASPDYSLVLGLADKFGIPYVPYTNAQEILDENGVAWSPDAFLKSRYSTFEILAATASYTAALGLFSPIQENGFALLPPESDLYLPFGEFAAKYGITPIAEAVRSVMLGFGYGYYETTPALYYMKLIGWLLKPSLTKGLDPATYYTFPTGFQSIWESVAQGLDVRLSSEVTSIVRPSPSGAPVEITINGGEHLDFDDVIISAPPNRVSRFMALSDAEQGLFAQVEGERYDVSIFQASGLTGQEALFFYGNANPSRINHTVAWANRTAGAPFVGWQILDPSTTDVAITSTLADDVASRGGQLGGVLVRQDWDDYFPHVGTDALRSGFYYRMESLQGANHTFYVGGALSFETVEHSARYAQQTVKSHFPPAFLP